MNEDTIGRSLRAKAVWAIEDFIARIWTGWFRRQGWLDDEITLLWNRPNYREILNRISGFGQTLTELPTGTFEFKHVRTPDYYSGDNGVAQRVLCRSQHVPEPPIGCKWKALSVAQQGDFMTWTQFSTNTGQMWTDDSAHLNVFVKDKWDLMLHQAGKTVLPIQQLEAMELERCGAQYVHPVPEIPAHIVENITTVIQGIPWIFVDID
ncbi:MAG: hypothetical protein EB168_10985 [Euryarchaeota archaeon]|nr:hypothetical protein [Euryarchaeota archaeon]